jgi:DNA processing protein
MAAPRAIRVDDDDYPSALRRVPQPPSPLHVDGSLRGLERAIGIVGTRRATRAALDFTRTLARELAEHGVVIVSGGAEGIDRAAHEGALDASGGRTVAVLPTAIGSPYPRAHAALFDRIAERGARVSEHERAGGVRAWHFVARNRIIAALSRAVIVVQAPLDSGALKTASDANALGIPVLATPWAPTEHAAAGGLALLAESARLCRSADDALRAIGERHAPRAMTLPGVPLRDDDERAVLCCLGSEAIDRETLVTRSGLPAGRAQAALLRLLLDGAAHEDAYGIARRGPRS